MTGAIVYFTIGLVVWVLASWLIARNGHPAPFNEFLDQQNPDDTGMLGLAIGMFWPAALGIVLVLGLARLAGSAVQKLPGPNYRKKVVK